MSEQLEPNEYALLGTKVATGAPLNNPETELLKTVTKPNSIFDDLVFKEIPAKK